MSLGPRKSKRDRRRTTFFAEPLEEAQNALERDSRPNVVFEVPSTYISQQSTQLDVTLMRTAAANRKSLTVDFSATSGSLTGIAAEPGAWWASHLLPVNETVTFPTAQTADCYGPDRLPSGEFRLGADTTGRDTVKAHLQRVARRRCTGKQHQRCSAVDYWRPACLSRRLCRHIQQANGSGHCRGHPQLLRQVLAEPEFNLENFLQC